MMCAFPKQFFSPDNYDNQKSQEIIELEPVFKSCVYVLQNELKIVIFKPIFITKNLYITILGRVFQNRILTRNKLEEHYFI